MRCGRCLAGEAGFSDESGRDKQRAELRRQLGRAPLVVMLESADIGKLDDLPDLWRLDGMRSWTVHVQRSVNPPAVIVLKVAGQDTIQVALVH
jgi:hypothetical protein